VHGMSKRLARANVRWFKRGSADTRNGFRLSRLHFLVDRPANTGNGPAISARLQSFACQRCDLTRQVPGRPATGRLRQPRSAWIALVHDVYPAYVNWQQHEQIQEQIAENCQKMQERLTRKQAIRPGSALLTGLARCGFCGRAMSVPIERKLAIDMSAARIAISMASPPASASRASQSMRP
jgi:hypothetical protein